MKKMTRKRFEDHIDDYVDDRNKRKKKGEDRHRRRKSDKCKLNRAKNRWMDDDDLYYDGIIDGETQ